MVDDRANSLLIALLQLAAMMDPPSLYRSLKLFFSFPFLATFTDMSSWILDVHGQNGHITRLQVSMLHK